jgi:hypothetical protein
MTRWFRISKGPDVGDIFDSIDSFKEFAPDHGPGCYDVDEHSLDPLPRSNVAARSWGKMIHHTDGQVVLEPIPCRSLGCR